MAHNKESLYKSWWINSRRNTVHPSCGVWEPDLRCDHTNLIFWVQRSWISVILCHSPYDYREHMVVGARGIHREQCHIYSIYEYLCISGWKWRRKMTDLKQYWKAENSGHFHPQDLILCLQSTFTHAPGSFGVARSPCIWGSVFHSDITVFNCSRRMLRGKAE